MVYGMAWRTSDGTWYGLAMYVMVGGKANDIGYSPVHTWSGRCQLEVLFTVTGPVYKYRGILHSCSVHTYSSCSLLAGIVNIEIVNL